ncbi:HPr family phosphocarrier protein [Wukongibacter baidiensis]|uniref:HPr family phosphocarrier protein n=1 Tax=Wukongibacter baidiensis TaxID=1723361 RepID=UPI003D7F70FF
MIERKIKIINPTGLHARPAAVLNKLAAKFKSDIKLVVEDKEANIKSILAILAAGVGCGTDIVLKADGNDEKEAIEEIGSYLATLKE